jgi:hypothetical protein
MLLIRWKPVTLKRCDIEYNTNISLIIIK